MRLLLAHPAAIIALVIRCQQLGRHPVRPVAPRVPTQTPRHATRALLANTVPLQVHLQAARHALRAGTLTKAQPRARAAQ
jgi:hypothetical protein